MKILYAGDNEQTTNHFFSGTESVQVFQRQTKDYKHLLEALESHPEAEIDQMTGAEAIEQFPATLEELERYDVVILSDLTRDTLLPHFLPDAIPGPNRVKLLRSFVTRGGGLIFCGGWMAFQGYHGVGNWYDSHLAEVLPLEIQTIPDDRIEAPEGVDIEVVNTTHPVMDGIDWDETPPLYGYNETAGIVDGGELLATVNGEALLGVTTYGEGRVLAYASDPAPKWGLAFLEWEGYEQLWEQALEWVSSA